MRRFLASLLVITFAGTTTAWAQDELSLDTKLTLNFQSTRLELALEGIQKAAKINLVAGPGVDLDVSVTAKASNETIGVLLSRIQKELGLERSTWCNAVVLHPQGKKPGAEPARPKGEGAKRLAQRVRSVSFSRKSLSDVSAALKAKTKQEFGILSFPVRKHIKSKGALVTLSLYNTRLRDILHHVARACDLSWSLQKGKIVFSASGSAEASASDDDQVVDYDVLRGDTFKKGPSVDVDRLVRQLGQPNNRGAASRLLVREGKSVCAKVAPVLKSTDPGTITAALQILEEIGDPSEYAAVLAVFKNEEHSLELRTAAGSCLGAIKAPEAVGDLIEALNDPWFRISETARQALIAIGSPASEQLVKRFDAELVKERGGKDGVMYRALLIFGEIGDTTCKKTLLRALRSSKGSHDRAVAVRHHAAIGLGMANDVRLVEPLIAALKRERDFRVAKYIARSLTWITDHTASKTSGDRWQIWWDLEGRRKFLAKTTAKDVLDDVAGGEVDLPLDDQGFARLETNAERLKRLAAELGDKEQRKRRAAWRELEAMGDAALPTLRSVLENGNPRAKANARAIIARIEGKPTEDE